MNWLRTFFRASGGSDLLPEQQARLAAWKSLPESDTNASHLQSRYIVVDIETSGLDLKKDRLISIGAVAVDGGFIQMLDAFEVVLRQEQASNTDNILIHGIGGVAQRDGVEPAEALLRFLEYVGKAPLVAYHAYFDQGMLNHACKRFIGFQPELTWHDLAWVLPELFPDRISGIVGLDTWLEQFRIENYQRHNAVSDCLAAAQLLQIVICRASAAGLDSSRQLRLVERARRALRRS